MVRGSIALKIICGSIFIAIFVQGFVLRCSIIRWRPINVDEPWHLQNVYRIIDGEKPYIHYFEPKVPLAYYVVLPIVYVLKEPDRVYVAARWLNAFVILLNSIIVFVICLLYTSPSPRDRG
mgnify:CR=1 FL=1